MDIRHDLEIELENDLWVSAEEYAERDQILAKLASEEFDEGEFSRFSDDYADEDEDYDDVSYDGESADFGLFEDF